MEQRLKADVIAIQALTKEQQKMMFSLYAEYYEGFEEDIFYQDLSDKHWAIVLQDDSGVIRGFTTLFVSDHVIDKQPIRSVFSGDTIIHHDFWGEQALPHAWCHFAGILKAQKPNIPLYWFLIVKGHRTYRYLRVFSKTFYPVHSKPTPVHIQNIMDQLGSDRFGQHYSPNSGLIQFSDSHGYLKKGWSGIDQSASKRIDVKYFLQRNPNFQKGDELVCLTELTEDNLQRYALVAFCEGLQSAKDFG